MSDSHVATRKRPRAAVGDTAASAGDATAVQHRHRVDYEIDYEIDGPASRPQAERWEDRRAEHGGLSVAAVFFGWLVAAALPALLLTLTGLVAAVAGASLEVSRSDAREQAQAIGIAGGLLLVLFMFLGYFAGGFVAGRMTRFHAGRQGIAVWAFGLVTSIGVTIAGAVVTTGYSLNQRLDLSTVSVPEGAFDARGIFAFAFLLLTTLLTAVVGARSGQRYHAKIDA